MHSAHFLQSFNTGTSIMLDEEKILHNFPISNNLDILQIDVIYTGRIKGNITSNAKLVASQLFERELRCPEIPL